MKELSSITEGCAATNWRRSITAYTNRRVLQVLALGFASGLPLLLTFSTLSAWLATAGVRRAAIGAFALVGTPYAFKFLWSPLIDRLPPPLPLGRRRGWGITIQIVLICAILSLGSCNPRHNLTLMAALSLLVAFLSASQDIVIDAWRVEILKMDLQGPGAGMIQTGYRIAMLVSGAGALVIAARAGWFAAYFTMAALLGVGMLVFLFGPEPNVPVETARTGVTGWKGVRQLLATAVKGPVTAVAALAGYPDLHCRLQAGGSDGGSDGNTALHLARVFPSRDRHRIQTGRVLCDRGRGSGWWVGNGTVRLPGLAYAVRRTPVGRQPVLCAAGCRRASARLSCAVCHCRKRNWRNGRVSLGELSLQSMFARLHRDPVRAAVLARGGWPYTSGILRRHAG